MAVLALVCLTGWAIPGCRDASAPKVIPVAGTVRYQGKPLDGATVVFATSGETPGATVLAIGTTDAQGRFRVKTQVGSLGSYEGAVAGTHRVTISKFIPPNHMTEQEYQQKVEAEKKIMEAKGQLLPGEAAPAKVQLLNPGYSNSQKTTLTAKVQAGETNEFTFDLK
jgi:hypothetical protein